MTTVLAVMQNQWFRDPESVRRIMARRPQMRRQLIARFLFAGCRSGRVLKRAFGARINEIVWEEASPEIGGKPSDCFRADLAHLRAVLDDVKPDIVIGFGKIACDALVGLVPGDKLLIAPHPTARSSGTPWRLSGVAACLDSMLERRNE